VLARIWVNGIVQGVGFRPFVYRIAVTLGLKGYVLNMGDAGVEIEVEGEEEKIKKFVETLEKRKPPLASIESIKIEFREEKGYENFEIRKSREERGEGISVIPPDIAICDDCLEDMEREGRRHNYFFTTCTNCGPRFTIIKRLPYDRPNTTMDEFEMCKDCHAEYTNPLDRRYHAQTIACRNCGPEIFLKWRKETLKGEDAIWKACEILGEGKIVAIKGVGGYHLSCIASNESAVRNLRRLLGRPQKPFALMAKNMEMVREIAYVNEEEEKMLLSHIRPIVLLNKRKELPHVAPHLHNYGVMLPYTGLHYLLFKKIDAPLIMTSANFPGKPIIHTEKEIERMGADAILFYNRRIWQRCDDSIVRVVDGRALLIRRSRGFVPVSIPVAKGKTKILATGAEENVVACLLKEKHAFLTQYLGHVNSVENLEFFEDAIKHLSGLINFKAEGVACDMHPAFLSSKYAEGIAEKENIPLFRVQHHHAHVAGVMAEYGLKEAIGIAMDGFGYGEDGMAWGGEVMYSDVATYERVAHLEYHPMPGGDMATRYPLRMVAGILGREAEEFLMERRDAFPHGEKEIEVVLKMVEKERLKTSSCGRLLDGIAAMLDICHKMHYEGEGAMKLESVARNGRNILEMESEIKNGVIHTREMVRELFESRRKARKEDIAYSAEEYIATSMAEAAIMEAEKRGIRDMVLSGGCTYNEHITGKIKERVEEHGLNLFLPSLIPCGDGGISFGQAMVAAERIK